MLTTLSINQWAVRFLPLLEKGFASTYYQLVKQRVSDLWEVRIQGIQTLGEFIKRRLEPAINTCTSLRAKMQLRMQQMVESISMVAITYYAASLISKIAAALHALGWHVNPGLIEGLAIPFIVIIIAISSKRIHKTITNTTEE